MAIEALDTIRVGFHRLALRPPSYWTSALNGNDIQNITFEKPELSKVTQLGANFWDTPAGTSDLDDCSQMRLDQNVSCLFDVIV